MEKTLLNIIDALRATSGPLAPEVLDRIIRARNREVRGPVRHVAKKMLLPFYQKAKEQDAALWRSWGVDDELEARLVRTLLVKPTRTASGVATVTVITKPWPCSGSCLFCPNDVRMPKSYLADEPACQRAERNWFDPYLQVALRLRTLADMGHVTDKVELIVLGGTWTDYPPSYRAWFACELFRALNEAGAPELAEESIASRRAFYEECGVPSERDACADAARETQEAVRSGRLSYNQAVARLFGESGGWRRAARIQHADACDVERAQRENERATHRSVGLVMETRPDAATPAALAEMRRLGATKVQMGIQSLDEAILDANGRGISVECVGRAFGAARLLGFKLHAHFMANLLGADAEGDKRGFEAMVRDGRFLPDEVKLYPCALVDGTGLKRCYDEGLWRPYTEEELLDVLAYDVSVTPLYVRISRMIRDISAHDILVGNKKVNLRQMVDARLEAEGVRVREIRTREIGTRGARIDELSLEVFPYETAVSSERFLQWVTPEGGIAGFLRLSLPREEALADLARQMGVACAPDEAAGVSADSQAGERGRARARSGLPRAGEAMIREVHVYGSVAALHRESAGAQHSGLGRHLVVEACRIAAEEGFSRINVISAVGTREYYRSLGFHDGELYQWKEL